MSTNKITLNNSGVSILGNALLLGCTARQASLRAGQLDESDRQEIGRDRANCRTLRNALYAAGMLDNRIAEALDASSDALGDGAINTVQQLGDIASGETQIAIVRFADFDYPAVVSERYGINEALAVTETTNLQTPIAQLWPSNLMNAVRTLVIDYLKDCAALDLGLTRAEAEFVGLEALVNRRSLREPPEWRHWNSPAARQTRKNTGWLEEMREKIRRHVVLPAERLYRDELPDYDVPALGGQLVQLGAMIKDGHIRLFVSLSELGVNGRVKVSQRAAQNVATLGLG
jgi:hypothetical protein